jgi:hypothetical protein
MPEPQERVYIAICVQFHINSQPSPKVWPQDFVSPCTHTASLLIYVCANYAKILVYD